MKTIWPISAQHWVGAFLLCSISPTGRAQASSPEHPAIVVEGQTYTPHSIWARNMGTKEDQSEQFPPHKIIANIYSVGTKTLTSFLIVTPAGNILMNSTYERNVPTIKKSVEELGFKFSDTKILLGNHAHGDHMQGDAMVKELTGAKVIAMAEDVPALQAMKSGGKAHPIDQVIHDGDSVTLGGTTLVAHLTPGHTHGATAWTMKASEGGKSYNVVFFTSLRSPVPLTGDVEEELNRSFKIVKTIPCDVPLGDHPAQFGMLEKYPKIKKDGPNPYIDPPGCKLEAKIEEEMFRAILLEHEVVGISGDVRGSGLDKEADAMIYVPLWERAPSTIALAVRTAGELVAAVGALREGVRAIDSRCPFPRSLPWCRSKTNRSQNAASKRW